MNRRTFVSSLAVAGAATAAAPSRLFASSSSSRPKVGLIGCGWFGGVNLENFARNADIEVISLADPNRKALEKTLVTVSKYQTTLPKTFAHYRDLLASAKHDIILVATPDHWHALPAIEAMQAGADVYLEKPIGVDVIEGEALVAAARKYDRVVQINTQRRSNPVYHEMRDKYLRSGRLGQIGLVENYSYLGGRPPGHLPAIEPPAHLDYDLWCGPAPKLPYRNMFEVRGWRAFMEYGNGQIGDLGVHSFDLTRWLLDLGWPDSISSTGGIYVDRDGSSNISDNQRAVFRYPHLDVSWEHRTWGTSPVPLRHWSDQWGTRIIGEHGTLNITMLTYEFTPADGGPKEGFHMLSKTGDLENIDFDQQAGAYNETERRHVLDFLAARENRSRPIADIEEGHISTACIELANLALELGRPVSYDPATRTVRNDPEATARLARPYRAPWQHPTPSNI